MKKLCCVLLFCIAKGAVLLKAQDPIQIYNTSNQDLPIAIYYVPKFGSVGDRATEVRLVPQGTSITVDRPSNWNPLIDRMLLTKKVPPDQYEATFPKALLKADIAAYGAGYIGRMQGSTFYLLENLDGTLDVLNYAAYLAVQAYETFKLGIEWIVSGISWGLTGAYDFSHGILAKTSETVRNNIKATQKAFLEYPYKDTKASVRIGSTVSDNERKAIQARERIVRQAMESKLGTVQQVPKIAFIASGGGYRAMLCALGFLTGAQRIGLIDMSTWIAALSGGVWGTMSYLTTAIESKARGGTTDLNALRQELITRISGKGLESISDTEYKLLSDNWLVNAATGQTITTVDVYGALVANQILRHFGDNRFRTYLWQFANDFEQGNYPIPLLTTVAGEEGFRPAELPWYEYTPWEMRGPRTTRTGAREWHFVPTWALGRNFDKGESTDFELSKNLGFMYGACGSAFAATIDQILDEVVGKVDYGIVQAIIREIDQYVGQKRLTWGEIYNFTRGLPTSPMPEAPVLKMVDAGLSFNLPYPVVSGEVSDRVPDILIFLDASADVNNAPELKKAEDYARSHKLKFPKIDYTAIGERAVSVFKDEKDPTVPTVIYLPRINQKGLWDSVKDQEQFKEYGQYVQDFDVAACVAREACGTFNFKYTPQEALKLSKLTEFNIFAAQDIIFNEVKQRAGVAS